MGSRLSTLGVWGYVGWEKTVARSSNVRPERWWGVTVKGWRRWRGGNGCGGGASLAPTATDRLPASARLGHTVAAAAAVADRDGVSLLRCTSVARASRTLLLSSVRDDDGGEGRRERARRYIAIMMVYQFVVVRYNCTATVSAVTARACTGWATERPDARRHRPEVRRGPPESNHRRRGYKVRSATGPSKKGFFGLT